MEKSCFTAILACFLVILPMSAGRTGRLREPKSAFMSFWRKPDIVSVSLKWVHKDYRDLKGTSCRAKAEQAVRAAPASAYVRVMMPFLLHVLPAEATSADVNVHIANSFYKIPEQDAESYAHVEERCMQVIYQLRDQVYKARPAFSQNQPFTEDEAMSMHYKMRACEFLQNIYTQGGYGVTQNGYFATIFAAPAGLGSQRIKKIFEDYSKRKEALARQADSASLEPVLVNLQISGDAQ